MGLAWLGKRRRRLETVRRQATSPQELAGERCSHRMEERGGTSPTHGYDTKRADLRSDSPPQSAHTDNIGFPGPPVEPHRIESSHLQADSLALNSENTARPNGLQRCLAEYPGSDCNAMSSEMASTQKDLSESALEDSAINQRRYREARLTYRLVFKGDESKVLTATGPYDERLLLLFPMTAIRGQSGR